MTLGARRLLRAAAILGTLGLACNKASPPPSGDAASSSAEPLDPAPSVPGGVQDRGGDAARGEAIFLRGEGAPGHQITAEIGPGNVLAATSVPCVSCHGRDGKGKAEGGITPSDIRWESLTRPYSVVVESARLRPPYDDRSLRRAISMGVDSGGNALQIAMPRYRMTLAEAGDLLAFLKTLGAEETLGITSTEIRIGAIVTDEGPLAAESDAVRAALDAYFEEVNRAGGIFGRRLVLVRASVKAAGSEREGGVREFLARERPFALAGALLTGDRDPIVSAAEELQVPLVGAIAGSVRRGGRYVFYLRAGLVEEEEALVTFAAQRLPRAAPAGSSVPVSGPAGAAPGARSQVSRAGIVHGPDEASRAAAARVAARCKREGLGEPADIEVDARDGARALDLGGARPEVVFFLGPSGAEKRLWESVRGQPRPLFLVPGALFGAGARAVPPAFDGRLYTTVPWIEDPPGLPEVRRLQAEHHLGEERIAAQMSALAAGKILVKALTDAGRTLTREALIRSLEGLHGYSTGLLPPVTYGPDRRVGALGAYVVPVHLPDGRSGAGGVWISAQ